MKTYQCLGFVGLAAVSLFASQAFATVCPVAPVGGALTQGGPACIAPTSPDLPGDNSLQGLLDSVTSSGPGIDVYNGQAHPSAWWSVASSSGSFNNLVFEVAGNANLNSFGIFDPTDKSNTLELFSGAAGAGSRSVLVNNGGGNYQAGPTFGTPASAHFSADNLFGYYLETPTGFFYSVPSMNNDAGSAAYYPNGMPHMVAFQGDGVTKLLLPGSTRPALFDQGEYFLAWEDLPFLNSDLDYNDFVVLVESVHPVPEPAVLGMFGLGALMIGIAVGMRRRREDV